MKAEHQTIRFGDMVHHINERVEPSETDLEIYVGLEHLDPESLKIGRWGTPSDVTGTKLRFYPGDIIFGKRRYYQKKLAVAEFDGICSAHAMILRAKPQVVLPEFLPFFMQSEMFFERAMAISVGSLSPTINWSTLKKQEFPLPPLDEQRRIAEILWAVEDVIEAFLNSRLDAKQARLSWINKHIGRNLRLSQLKEYSGDEFNVTTLEEVCDKITDGTHQPPEFANSGIPFLLVSNLTSGQIDWNVDKWISYESYLELTKNTKPEFGDVLYTVVGSFGVPVLIEWENEFSFQRHIGLIKPNRERLLGAYLAYFLESSLGKKQAELHAVGNAQRTITLTALKQYILPVPDIEKQQQIVGMIAHFENSIQKLEYHLLMLDNIKKNNLETLLIGAKNYV